MWRILGRGDHTWPSLLRLSCFIKKGGRAQIVLCGRKERCEAGLVTDRKSFFGRIILILSRKKREQFIAKCFRNRQIEPVVLSGQKEMERSLPYKTFSGMMDRQPNA
ncbi:hypothetical protein CHARACLAT_021212 [Characodon lateralis]|uniref:Uncharacterized protein n=1 Tax=Characodon lateralis TaxID=208331 RepID=A0ABU7CQ67_9TELE|nr:hypothetical protein [Characodon lateralis]